MADLSDFSKWNEKVDLAMKMARVGVLLDRKAALRRWDNGLNVFQVYLGEILSHAGIPFEWIDDVEQLTERAFDVLLVALDRKEERAVTLIWRFAERGGIVIAYGGLSSLAGRLGFADRGPVGKGYAWLPMHVGVSHPLRYLRATPWIAMSEDGPPYSAIGQIHSEHPQGASLGSALLQFHVGKGIIDRWAVDIAETVVGLQQGAEPVIEDGIPALDGTASIDDGMLKADDGMAMDWELDRLTTETATPYFAHPYADWWREVMIGHLLNRVVDRGLTLPFVGYWPAGIEQVAMISLDSDLNVNESAETTLAVLREHGVKATWCMMEPGYDPRIYPRVLAEGHELAFHYNAVEHDQGKWGEAEFQRQLQWLKKATDLTEIHSNKNHYTRFEGWGELFRWCETHGIASDQTRGPSKKGNVGFLFGTCHPYFPISWADEKNRLYDVLEVGFLTQDLNHPRLADMSVTVPFLERVRQVRGVAHFLFHQVHIHNQPSVRKALRNVVNEAKRRGFVFWTGKQISEWERARRTVRVVGIKEDGTVQLTSGKDVADLVVWVPVPQGQRQLSAETMARPFGVPCIKKVVSVNKTEDDRGGKQRKWAGGIRHG